MVLLTRLPKEFMIITHLCYYTSVASYSILIESYTAIKDYTQLEHYNFILSYDDFGNVFNYY